MAAQGRVGLFIYVGGQRFDFFKDYSLSSNLLVGVDQFRFGAPLIRANRDATRAVFKQIAPGTVVDLKTVDEQGNETQVLHGRIDTVDVETTKEGSHVSVVVRSHLAKLVDGDILPFAGIENITLADLAYKVIATAGYTKDDLVVDNSANRSIYTGGKAQTTSRSSIAAGSALAQEMARTKQENESALLAGLAGTAATWWKSVAQIKNENAAIDHALAGIPLTPDEQDALDVSKPNQFIATQPTAEALGAMKVDQAKPKAGETGWQFLVRHCRRFGLLIWGTCDGHIVIGRPNYDQKPLYEFRCLSDASRSANNVKAIARHHSFLNIPSEVHVYGHTQGRDYVNSAIHAVVIDTEMKAAGFERLLTIHDGDARTKQQAEARALYELSMRRQNSDVVHALVRGHSDRLTGAVFGIDTIGVVRWDAAGLDEPRYVLSRTLECTEKGARSTRVELIPKGAISLETSI